MIALIKRELLPYEMQNSEVDCYIAVLNKKRFTLALKRLFDIFASFFGLLILLIPFCIIAVCVKISDSGPVFFTQTRIGRYKKPFKILKFRTMTVNAEKAGLKITVGADRRVTKVGKLLRKTKIDELPQLINVFLGQMSCVGPRPEVAEYVDVYSDEMYATLLVRPGITSSASIKYRNENEILQLSDDPEKAYIDVVLPDKMKYNLEYINKLSPIYDLELIFKTIF